ncbi:hypothetical protein Vretifemale_9419 [Volvox reticuliferus]|uniref:GATA-type domain-containing protein n=1 Tax=Volvox reticuliferus TaxID=1737510 RepID=A0A8J4CCJ2_9CHLO|nr:hypothetical protein Vretifemale_9419 [Volvox reticuliferus]
MPVATPYDCRGTLRNCPEMLSFCNDRELLCLECVDGLLRHFRQIVRQFQDSTGATKSSPILRLFHSHVSLNPIHRQNIIMSGPSQVEFFFSGPPLAADSGVGARTDYAGFNLNGVEYKLGDCAYLYPEDEDVPPYVGRILACFHDRSGRAADPHCVEVAWYERRAHLEPNSQGGNWEREVVALEETDINPIGCISGKIVVFTAGDYEEARQMAKSMDIDDWLFCRGVYKQFESSFVPFMELAGRMESMDGKWHGKRGPAGMLGHMEGVADSDEVKRQRVVEEQPVAPVRRSGKLVSGRTCVECGATQTPQWREGPAGPKTLCNACGVRYVRAQQRANKRSATSGGVRCGYGSGGRQSRTSKVAKAEAASARAARATATAAANAAEEASQRPQRQAALMAASKTAQYARTGVFPLSSIDLQPQHNSANDHDAAMQEPRQQPLQHQQHDTDGFGTDACAGVFGQHPVATGACTVVRPGTPNCSSYDSCGSLQEGVTVEVVVGPVDGDAECGGRGMGIAAAATAAPASPTFLSTAAGMLPSPPSDFPGDSGVIVQSAESITVVAPVLTLGTNQLNGQQISTLHTSAVATAAAGVLRASSGFIMGSEPVGGDIFFATAQDCQLGGHSACFPAEPEQMCPQPAVECGLPTLSGSCGGVASADCIPGGCAPLKGCAAAHAVVSAPVSPSVQGNGSDGFTCCDYVGDGLLDAELRGYGSQLGCKLAAGLDEEYGPLVEVEVDFGLGPASAIADGSLFGEFNHSPCDGDDDDDLQPRQHLQPQFHNQQQQWHHDDSDECVFNATDLPAVAARVAAFCPDLAPGTDARELLNSVPMLAQVAVTPHGTCSSTPTGEMPAAPASAAATTEDNNVALPEDAVAHLVALGRQASRAATEAMAADAAFQAVGQLIRRQPVRPVTPRSLTLVA